MKRFVSSLVVAGLPWISGCGASPPAPPGPGETAFVLENRVEAPCTLSWANARIDEQPLGRVTLTPAGGVPATLARTNLTAGPHVLTISAASSCGNPEDPSDLNVLQVTETVYVGKEGTAVKITLSNAPDAPKERLVARVEVNGGKLYAPRADGAEADCHGLLPMSHDICVTQNLANRAIAESDVVRAVCIRDKLAAMRQIDETQSLHSRVPAVNDGAAGPLRGPLPHSPPPPPPPASSAMRVMTATAPEAPPAWDDAELTAISQVRALAREAERCAGRDTMTPDGTQRTQDPPKPKRSF